MSERERERGQIGGGCRSVVELKIDSKGSRGAKIGDEGGELIWSKINGGGGK